jgi:shikimate kinase
MHIYLTGFMGVGKTTIGRKLSLLLDLPFIDLDEYIEEETGNNISQIFLQEGEAAFRLKEKNTLKSIISNREMHIIALGGGTMATVENSTLITHNGICIYLYKPWAEIALGIKSLKNRPIAAGLSLDELEAVYHKREPFYELSQVRMPLNTAFTPEKLADFLRLSTNR